MVGETRGDSLLQVRAALFVKNSSTPRARAVDHLAHRAERCRQAIQQDPDLFPKLETDMQAKLGPTGSTRAQESCETGEIVADGVSSGGLMQNQNCL